MQAGHNQRTRILSLLFILFKQTDEEHPLNARQLLQQLVNQGIECDRKTLYADLQALELAGFDLIHSRGKYAGYFLASREFEPIEVSLLIDAVLSADFITPKKTRELTEKLKRLVSKPQAKQLNSALCFYASKTSNEEIYYNIDTLRRGIQHKKQVQLQYQKHYLQNGTGLEKTQKQMTVSPYAMLWVNDHYYLICNYQKYDNLMHLRLDRIINARLTAEAARPFNEVSEYTDVFDTADYAAKSFNMFGGETATVKLKCSAELLEPILDRFGEQLYIQKCSAQSFIFSANVQLSHGLIGWILQFGDKIKVLAPKQLADSVMNAAEAVLHRYKPDESSEITGTKAPVF